MATSSTTEVWTGEPAQTEEELYRACRNISRSGSSGCFSGSVVTSVSNAGEKCAPEKTPVVGAVVPSTSNAGTGNVGLEGRSPVVECKPKQEAEVRREDFYWPEDFVLGDVVWARSGKKSPAWPALVINPLQHAPEVVLNSCVPGALCVMFFGYSAGGQNRRAGTDLKTLARRFWKVAAPYWWSEDKVQARLQLAGVFALTLATTGISVGFNFLGRDFYNALAGTAISVFLGKTPADEADQESRKPFILNLHGATITTAVPTSEQPVEEEWIYGLAGRER
ncbi:hypothetical protein TRIUR3_21690 [Triticum urartu]|uniref:Uncharacterized protein n=1 Tax=Triticum urartu TaxID=4572 RepID=M7ZDB7_TRIUA|nr:hypothetical protein TRIUR3_21690 [Triticum urartu]